MFGKSGNFTFYEEILQLVEKFCVEMDRRGCRMDSELEAALVSLYALDIIERNIEEIRKHMERDPIFEDMPPEVIYSIIRDPIVESDVKAIAANEGPAGSAGQEPGKIVSIETLRRLREGRRKR
ncbi:MAG: hypothetical protein ACUVXI_05630 [bacterium]